MYVVCSSYNVNTGVRHERGLNGTTVYEMYSPLAYLFLPHGELFYHSLSHGVGCVASGPGRGSGG